MEPNSTAIEVMVARKKGRLNRPAAMALATETRAGTATATRPVLLVVSWAIVGLPLAYGIYQTFVKVSSLV